MKKTHARSAAARRPVRYLIGVDARVRFDEINENLALLRAHEVVGRVVVTYSN